MVFQKGTRMFELSLLVVLGLILLGSVGAWKITKRGAISQKGNNCPSLENNSVKVDIRIVNQQQAIHLAHTFQNRSISPWDYNITKDPNRFPSEIAEARCRYSGCINAEGREENGKNSVPIQQEVLVLRRQPAQSCSPTFRLEKILVTVGCTCVTPITRSVA
ncbi:interleukin-17F [Phascolarctos cinereus]|uniref:Interleukin-17F n=1 Tax=Phascolarctos cinereus TaxID=38626 RepID=A0A6P5KUF8_PHACI|nr:interleukin-17F [Phascolarctos cinereus]